MNIRPKYIIAVAGDKPPYFENREYYDYITNTAVNLASKLGVNIIHRCLKHRPDDSIVDILTTSLKYAEKLKGQLSMLGIYRNIEIINISQYPFYPGKRYSEN